ncbi:hypothetical protein FSP39_012741 [Pinctada imbricata]|uniref:Sushi domain-containing protein n=1 Tax=Pinctada imbricata TaxID=66713 RepID=A0AA88XP71_PINIB|nr:hypothetical protein FSP39_012741 [Pinctada imbricata]
MTERSAVSIKQFSFNTARAKIVSIATDPRNNTLFIMDSDSHSLYRMEKFNIWINDSIEIVPLHKGVSKTSAQISYDWKSRNLYWVDGYYNWVAMQPAFSNDNSMYKVIIRNFTARPEGLTIDPQKGFLFWSEMSKTQRIERCNLLGEDRTVIISKNIGRVYDICTDTDEQRIYWVDGTRHTIETSDYNGQHRRILVRMNSIKFTSINLYEDHLYVASFTSNTVSKVNKHTGEVAMVILVDDGTPVSVEIYDPTIQLPLSTLCPKAKCEHFCVETPGKARCVCKEGYRLDPDGTSCIKENLLTAGLLLGNTTHICHLDIRQITALKEAHRCYTNFTKLRWLVPDTERNMLYYIDEKNEQLTQFSLSTNKSEPLTNSEKNVTGLAYDWINKNVFWAEGSSGNIHVYSVKNKAAGVLYAGRTKPMYIQANPLSGMIYWIEGSKPDYSIIAATMDGKDARVLVNKTALHSPTGLYYSVDNDRLYWINWHTIKTVKSDGSDPKSYLNIMSVLFFGVELMIYEDYAIWTHGRSFINAASIHKSSSVVKLNVTSYGDLTAMAIYDPSMQKIKRGPCDVMNGGCDQICLPTKEGGRVCQCDYGYSLSTNGTSCVTDPIDNNFLVVADHTHGRIYQISLLNKRVTAIDIPEVVKPACVALHKPSNILYWIEIKTGGSRIRKSNIDGSNATEIYSSGMIYPDRIAIDFSTGNLYFTAVSAITMGSYVGVIIPETGEHRQLVTGLFTPRAIALVPDKGIMFWTDHHKHNAHIGRAYMDGSDHKQIVRDDIVWPNGLTVDFKAERLYWADGNLDKIESVDYEGNGRLLVLEQKDSQLVDIVMYNSHLYFTAWNKQKIQKVKLNKNGTGILVDWMSDIAEFGRLDSLDIYPGQEQPVKKSCTLWNGHCSTFCLPVADGNVCGCSDGDELLVRGKICDKASRCPHQVPNVVWEKDCGGFAKQRCNYTCDAGYRKNKDLEIVRCGENTKWQMNGQELCIECPLGFPVRDILYGCSRKVNSTCGYACTVGYIRNPKIPTIKCLPSRKWDHEMSEICIPPNLTKYCKEPILYGSLSPDCSKVAGTVCSFTCDPGYIRKDDNIELVCLDSGKWSYPVTALCTASGSPVTAARKSQKTDNSTLYAGIGGAVAAFVVILVVIILIVVFIFIRKKRRTQVGRYKTHHNVYCEPDKGVVNIGSDVRTSDGGHSNPYANMSET